jgi:uncharacterized membrane protein
MCDVVVSFGGSWAFIVMSSIPLTIYTVINVRLGARAWDPYPFILLTTRLAIWTGSARSFAVALFRHVISARRGSVQ